MVKIIDYMLFNFRIRTVYFAEYPQDMENCDTIVFPFCRNLNLANGFDRAYTPTLEIDLGKSIEELWQKLDRKSTRYCISRAEKQGINIHINKYYKEYYKMYKNFMKEKGFGSNLNISIPNLEIIKSQATLFCAELDNELLAGSLYLEDGNNILLWHSGSKRLSVDMDKARTIGNANRLIHWEAIKYAKEKGIKRFDMGGIWPKETAENDKIKRSINYFKLSFGGELINCHSYNKSYSKIYKIGSKIYKKVLHYV